jgi:DGQHR domain-containing protein
MFTVAQREVTDMRRTYTRTVFEAPTKLPVVQGPDLRSGTPTIVGYMPAGVLIPDHYTIPYYDTRTKKGYQRQPQESRINQLANDLRKDRTDLPTAVLLNVRKRDAREAVDRGELELNRLLGLANVGTFHVVDGQHRVLALKKLIDEDTDRWSQLMIPFVCLLGAPEEEEMEQFYIVNSTAKSVKTDLALVLLRRRADKDPAVYEALQERGREWQVDGQAIVERLAAESQIWKPRIRLPSMDKGETTIPSASMVTSLKPLLSSAYFGGLKPDQQIKVLDSYWHGIREVLRAAFDEPDKYAIQKGVGVIVMHSVLPTVLECVRTRGLLPVDPNSYKQILEDALSKLQGENGDGEPVSGVDFWASAPKGAAGSYSSSAGRRVLAAKIRQLLPSVEAE